MAFLFDTCAVSEPTQKSPNPRVLSFISGVHASDAFISAITIAEIWKGIELLPSSKRRTRLENWFEKDLLPGFDGRMLPCDVIVAQRLGSLTASLIRGGWTMPAFDSCIAATALTHDLTLVTRNESDFAHSGVRILNPWK
jgi:predicted nucleic acid-binding protein